MVKLAAGPDESSNAYAICSLDLRGEEQLATSPTELSVVEYNKGNASFAWQGII
ncbi:hypothetical protein BABINDRAFT_158979 [Babjeviella inositovora NRRL Y-12698]|uniref:Uncharacterized protein n=1 Tax=Babjeviella inositovora NRRL Y-12698 TaxID=984486 RepID=A0A1E3QXG9_9ASCO|nr:uncharacterized protein BABINDRAFT_158979 [Babjeviella inositovora NRRL Y-12698]ODQ82369.1 hypothetical protein BABINDRAFT_158979 [Babjeviella inositovora NRRL Y-12698]